MRARTNTEADVTCCALSPSLQKHKKKAKHKRKKERKKKKTLRVVLSSECWGGREGKGTSVGGCGCVCVCFFLFSPPPFLKALKHIDPQGLGVN